MLIFLQSVHFWDHQVSMINLLCLSPSPSLPQICLTIVTSECILPCVESAIYDVEERVVESAVRCLTSILQLKLFGSRYQVIELLQKCAALPLHPCEAVRQATISLIVAAAKVFGPVDTLLLLWPSVQKILQYPISFPPPDGLTISFLLNSVHTPLNRRRYRKALVASLGKGSAAQSLLEGILLEGDEGRATGEGGGEVSDQQQPSQVEPEIGSEDWKVFLLQDYIQHAAGEISKKAQQWRNGLMGQLQASIGTTLGSLQSRMLDTMVTS